MQSYQKPARTRTLKDLPEEIAGGVLALLTCVRNSREVAVRQTSPLARAAMELADRGYVRVCPCGPELIVMGARR